MTLVVALRLGEHRRHSLDPGDLLRILLRDCARPTDPRSVIKAIDPCLIVGVRLGLGLSLELMIRGEADDLASRGRS